MATAEQGILGSLSIDKGRLGGQKAENSGVKRAKPPPRPFQEISSWPRPGAGEQSLIESILVQQLSESSQNSTSGHLSVGGRHIDSVTVSLFFTHRF